MRKGAVILWNKGNITCVYIKLMGLFGWSMLTGKFE